MKVSCANRPCVVALIPAHNEEETIAFTVHDLVDQTYPLEEIIVVADNCTDDTARGVNRFSCQFPHVQLIETVDNKFRKAGAVNQALETLEDSVDFVLLMDADTRLSSQAIEVAVSDMLMDEELAAVCSKAGILPPTGDLSFFSWLLYRLQKLEYALFDSQRVETWGRIKVVHGMAALHRWKALKDVGFYDRENIVEDYELTLRYKIGGWRVTIEPTMLAWTDVPTDIEDWWRQRLRWYRGGVDALRKHGWNKVTWIEIVSHYVGSGLHLVQTFLSLLFIVWVLGKAGTFQVHGVVVACIAFAVFNSLYRVRYVEDPDFWDWFLRLVLLPESLYGHLNYFALYWSYFLSFTGMRQNW